MESVTGNEQTVETADEASAVGSESQSPWQEWQEPDHWLDHSPKSASMSRRSKNQRGRAHREHPATRPKY